MRFTLRFLVLFMAVAVLFACREKKELSVVPVTVPADSLISGETMILIIADMHVADAAMMLARDADADPDKDQGFYYMGIFRKYRISPARYDMNVSYYRQNPENFAKMYEKVIEVLENRAKFCARKK
ncbi:MAG: DUF4296 domain-containing protein [bacterium]